MSSEIKFSKIPGSNKSWKIKLYALSTCAHCHRVMSFLKDRSIEFEYVYMDHIKREIVKQLRGEADQRQVADARIGLTHNVGGSGVTCVVHIGMRVECTFRKIQQDSSTGAIYYGYKFRKCREHKVEKDVSIEEHVVKSI